MNQAPEEDALALAREGAAVHPLTTAGAHNPSASALHAVPARPSLRRARRRAHRAFDQLWERLGISRGAAYRWLAARMGLSREACHISLFDEAQCARVVQLCDGFQVLPNSQRKAA